MVPKNDGSIRASLFTTLRKCEFFKNTPYMEVLMVKLMRTREGPGD
jgi:hypothetical protein